MGGIHVKDQLSVVLTEGGRRATSESVCNATCEIWFICFAYLMVHLLRIFSLLTRSG